MDDIGAATFSEIAGRSAAGDADAIADGVGAQRVPAQRAAPDGIAELALNGISGGSRAIIASADLCLELEREERQVLVEPTDSGSAR